MASFRQRARPVCFANTIRTTRSLVCPTRRAPTECQASPLGRHAQQAGHEAFRNALEHADEHGARLQRARGVLALVIFVLQNVPLRPVDLHEDALEELLRRQLHVSLCAASLAWLSSCVQS